MLVNCPTCVKPMELRTGKYGDFFYCREHGTVSKLAAMALTERTSTYIPTTIPMYNADLMDTVRRQGVAMGHHLDETGQLVDWYNDTEIVAEGDNDHWMNTRPY